MSKEVGREFIFGTYVRNEENPYEEDAVIVKEHLHHPDGTITPNLRIIENYQRKFYITKKDFQDHEQKKEFEFKTRLDEHSCTNASMVRKVGTQLGMWRPRRLSEVNESPFVYGTDISTVSLIHNDYKKRYPDHSSFANLAVFDYETDMLDKFDGGIICGSVSYKVKVVLSVRHDFLRSAGLPSSHEECEKLIRETVNKHLGEIFAKRNITLEIDITGNDLGIVKTLFKKKHEWKPDYIGVWNLPFEINHTLAVCDLYNVDPKGLFSDPNIPSKYHNFNWIEGKPKKEKSDGETVTQHFQDLWHRVDAPASFQYISMDCLYKHIRLRDGQRSSYALDSVLNDEINMGKLNFPEADGLVKAEWHRFMQERYPLEYLAYNIFDCIGCEILDETTLDVANTLRAQLGITELGRFKSIPKKRADDFHFRLEKAGKIIGSTSGSMIEELDAHTPSTRRWIIALSADLEKDMGSKLIEHYPRLVTNIVAHNYDSDIKSSYPTTEVVCNVGKSTSRVEVCAPIGGSGDITREWGINLSAPRTNALYLARVGFGYPTNEQALAAFLAATGT